MNFTELIAEVQDLMVRSADTELITSTRVGIWVNEAQRRIVRKFPGLRDVNTVSRVWLAADEWEYSLSTALGYIPISILGIRWEQRTQKIHHRLNPYPGGREFWDRDFPYIPDRGTGQAEYYFLRGNTLELDIAPGVY